MKKQYFALSLGFVALLAATEIASAQSGPRCATRDLVLDRLTGKYGETRRSIGMAPNNSVVEVYASETTGSWTITVTHPNGLTCMVAAGTAFEKIDEKLPASLGDPT